jgi:UPF0716 protein FxsA
MYLLLLLLILLAFPALEFFLLVELARLYGWWVLAYLVLSALCGWTLISGERLTMLPRILQTLREGEHPMLVVLSSARTFVAGALLIFPGVLSDILAVLLLIIPISLFHGRKAQKVAEEDFIETEWHREE